VTVEEDGWSGHWHGVETPFPVPGSTGVVLVHTVQTLRHSRMVFTVSPNGVESDSNVTVEWWVPGVWSQANVDQVQAERILVDLRGHTATERMYVCSGTTTRPLPKHYGRGVWAGLVGAGWVPVRDHYRRSSAT
jgi:hypothetical protein